MWRRGRSGAGRRAGTGGTCGRRLSRIWDRVWKAWMWKRQGKSCKTRLTTTLPAFWTWLPLLSDMVWARRSSWRCTAWPSTLFRLRATMPTCAKTRFRCWRRWQHTRRREREWARGSRGGKGGATFWALPGLRRCLGTDRLGLEGVCASLGAGGSIPCGWSMLF